ncbi:unnamed protein product [Paramecium primaurelia]|uniref:Tr-type G domain-containing protein n=1 Tax=Paramecium primaurelia TaxID=5886 RepID=A0A8S1L157_PARPR|nr:unnamed protein product [Paramecium primaurelia]
MLRTLRQFSSIFHRVPLRSFSGAVEVTPKDDILKILHSESRDIFRNVAIIAHVDHGKTTLVDALLRASGCANEYDSMDSNALEKEKGITILSKVTGVTFGGNKINIVDTPGHQDFGGEVERIMSMVDGVCLLVCATEGPMAQTRFVLQKALQSNLKPIVIINKVDRPSARPVEVEHEIFNLFCDLEAPSESLDYPLYFCSGKEGWVRKGSMEAEKQGLEDVLETIVETIPPPQIGTESSFKMLVSQQESHPYYGKIVIGKIHQGEIKLNDKILAVDQQGKLVETAKVLKILRRYGMQQLEMARAVAGDIVQVAGFTNAIVTNTLNEMGKNDVIPSIPIDPPMISVSIGVNTGPLAGKEGTKLNAQQIKERLMREGQSDVALQVMVKDKSDDSACVQLLGRGDLHLAILLENMRREGFEMQVSPPQIVTKKCPDTGKTLEPMEKVTIEIDQQYMTGLIDKMSQRKAIYEDCINIDKTRVKLIFSAPTRGLVGLRAELINDTRGTAIMQQQFLGYQEYRGTLKKNLKGAIISMAAGVCQGYALEDIQKFGPLFVKPGSKVYVGQVIGEHKLEQDIEVNPIREKKLTNVRTVLADEKISLFPPKVFTLEDVIAYIRDDELVEVTPKDLRIRKKELDSTLRKTQRKNQSK